MNLSPSPTFARDCSAALGPFFTGPSPSMLFLKPSHFCSLSRCILTRLSSCSISPDPRSSSSERRPACTRLQTLSNGVLSSPSRRVFESPCSSVSIHRSLPAQLFLTSLQTSSFSSSVIPLASPLSLTALTSSLLLVMLLFLSPRRSAKSPYIARTSFFSLRALDSTAWCANFSTASSVRSPVYPLFSIARLCASAGYSPLSSARSVTAFRTTAKENVARTSSSRSPLHSSSIVLRTTASRPRNPFFFTTSRERRRAARRLRDWTWSVGGKKGSSF